MITWGEIRRCRQVASDYSDAAEMCLTATIWALRRTEDRWRWAARVVELSKGAGAPRRIVWGEEIPMPPLLWWRERAARFARRAAAARRLGADLERSKRRLRKRRRANSSATPGLQLKTADFG
jgi:hypothetical protein